VSVAARTSGPSACRYNRVVPVPVVRVREAQPEDAAQMARVLVDSFTAAHRGQVSEAELASRSYAQSEAAWIRGMGEIQAARAARAGGAPGAQRHSDADTHFYVAELETGAIVGVAVAETARTDRQGSTVPEEWLRSAGEVTSLYVDVRHQRRGVGRHLVQAIAAQQAREGRPRLLIGVLAVNTPARRFYEAIGGQLIGRCLFGDEDGTMLDGVVYGWADTRQLLAATGEQTD
jgi:ribosomal protein S18 acetylase RimI-like enzyme